jgi:protein arginine kinase activator
MKCEMCSKNNAIIQIQQVINNTKRSIRLCKHCARSLGIISGKAGERSRFTIPNLFSKMFEGLSHEKQESAKKCRLCGTTLASVLRDERVGCTECYAAFAPQIEKIVHTLFGHIRHLGKYPKRFLKYRRFLVELLDLKKRLDVAVKAEDYENAAILRDAIKNMKESAW